MISSDTTWRSSIEHCLVFGSESRCRSCLHYTGQPMQSTRTIRGCSSPRITWVIHGCFLHAHTHPPLGTTRLPSLVGCEEHSQSMGFDRPWGGCRHLGLATSPTSRTAGSGLQHTMVSHGQESSCRCILVDISTEESLEACMEICDINRQWRFLRL